MHLFLKLGGEIVFEDRLRGSYLRLPTIFPIGIGKDGVGGKIEGIKNSQIGI